VVEFLYDEEREGLEEYITIRAKPGFHQEQFEISVS
jgi:ribonuclease G